MAIPIVAAIKVLMTPVVEALNEPRPADREPARSVRAAPDRADPAPRSGPYFQRREISRLNRGRNL